MIPPARMKISVIPGLSITPVLLTAILLSSALSTNVSALDPAEVPDKMKTSLGLYYSPAEAYDHMQKDGDKTLFLDVREPMEVNFTGMPKVADANVPFKFADRSKFHTKKMQFNMVTNENFVTDVETRIKEKGLTKSDTVILMCRSGTRGAAGVNALAKAGYTNVYNLIEGFEGMAVKEGPNKGQRTLNGWKNAGFPWDPPKSLSIEKMYGSPEPIIPKPKT